MPELGRWVKALIAHRCSSVDYNSSEDVDGWMNATLDGDVLVVIYEQDGGLSNQLPLGAKAPAPIIEKYRLVPIE